MLTIVTAAEIPIATFGPTSGVLGVLVGSLMAAALGALGWLMARLAASDRGRTIVVTTEPRRALAAAA